MNQLNKIHLWDVSRTPWPLEDESVHCIITSPPYWGLRDYKVPIQQWPEVEYLPMAGLQSLRIPAMECYLGLEPDIESFIGHLVLVFREAWRVLRKDGVAWVNMGDCYSGSGKGMGDTKTTNKGHKGSRTLDHRNKDFNKRYFGKEFKGQKQQETRTFRPLGATSQRQGRSNNGLQGGNNTTSGLPPKNLIGQPWRLAFALQADGWYLRNDNIWNKANCMPESVHDRCTRNHEYIFQLAKSERYFFDMEAIKEPIAKSTANDHRFLNPDYENNNRKERGLPDGSHPKKFGLMKSGAHSRGTKLSPPKETKNGWAKATPDILTTRNKRTVWDFSIQPFKEAHFATFPEKLPEICLLASTSTHGVCSKCGKPWERIVEPDETRKKALGKSWTPHEDDLIVGNQNSKVAPGGYLTIGWLQKCKCKAGTIPATVFDPFMGSGTVAKVALRAGRQYIGLELGPQNIEIAERRIKPITHLQPENQLQF